MYKILIAEDDEDIRYIYSKMKLWKECGFTVEKQTSNGEEALKALESDNYDLLITDIRMPLVDGIELLREIKKRSIGIEVIFVSTYDDFEYARQGLILGAFDYILKPIDKAQMKNSILRAKEKLDEKRYEQIPQEHVLTAFEYFHITLDNLFNNQVYQYLCSVGEKIITMEDVSEHFELSKDYFGKLFKQNCGVSFNNFYSVLKVEFAKELIKTSNYKAYEISEILGYSSANYFRLIFKDVTGVTPTEYRHSEKFPDF